MQKAKWPLVLMIVLSLLFAGSPALAQGKGKGNGSSGQKVEKTQGKGKGNGSSGKKVEKTRGKGQWNNNQPPGWSKGKKKGWDKHDSTIPPGLDKNLENKGKYPKGLQKDR